MGAEQFEGYTRLTEILSFFKSHEYWEWVLRVGKKEANRVGKIAMSIGTNVDEAIKAEILGGKKVTLKTDAAKNCFKAYERWVYENLPVDVEVGTRIFDENVKVTGEPDIFTADTLIDIKCSQKIRPEYWLQTEWYARHLGKTHKAILRLDKNLSDYEYKRMPLNDEHWEAVQGAIKLFAFFKPSPVEDGQGG